MNVDPASLQRASQSSRSFQQAALQPPPYAIDANSLGWLIVGASSVADQFAIDAIRSQSPVAHGKSVNSWVAGVHSHHAGRGQQFAIKHHIPHASDDLSALLQRDSIQCAYVANHPRHHFESVRTALLAGKHVLCEPPLALTIEDAQALAEIANRYALLLAVNFTHRCDPTLLQLKTLLAREPIGELVGGRLINALLLETRQRTWRLQPTVGGALLQRTLFDIDLLRFLLDDEISQIQAQSHTRIHTEAMDEDVQSTVQLKKSKLVLALYDSFLVPHVDSQLEFFGTHGRITVTNCLSLQKNSELILTGSDSVPTVVQSNSGTQSNQRFINSFAAFNNALRNNNKPTASAQDFIAALNTIEAARQSLKQKQWTSLAPLNP